MIYKAQEVFEKIWIGSSNDAYDSDFLKRNNINNIINLTKDIPNKFYYIKYLRVPVLNNTNYSSLFMSYIAYSIFFIKKAINKDESVLIFSNNNILSILLLVIYISKIKNITYKNAVIVLESKLQINNLQNKIRKNEITI